MQGQIELFRCKNIHGIRHKLHIFANRLLLRRDIQQSQCRSNHRIKIDSMLCPDVRIHKYLNKHGILPLRQQPVLHFEHCVPVLLGHHHAGFQPLRFVHRFLVLRYQFWCQSLFCIQILHLLPQSPCPAYQKRRSSPSATENPAAAFLPAAG